MHDHHRAFSTCKKGLKSNDKRQCRLDYPRKPCLKTYIHEKSGAVVLERDYPMIVPYNPALSMAVRCNTAVEFIGSGVNAKATMFYVTDYVTKSELNTEEHLISIFYGSMTRLESQHSEVSLINTPKPIYS
jgi:hypothetical protein